MSLRSPIAIVNGNLSKPENLVLTSVYTVRTDSMDRGKKLSRVGKGIPDMHVAFLFGAK